MGMVILQLIFSYSMYKNGGVPNQDESTHIDKGSSGKLENLLETKSQFYSSHKHLQTAENETLKSSISPWW